jgi:hypothetical protein
VSSRLNMARSTVYRVRHDLLESFLRWFYHEPEYAMPWRTYSKADSEEGVP